MKKSVIMLLIASAAVLSAAEDALMLFDFEDPKTVKAFVTLQGNANKVVSNDKAEYVASGKRSALFYVPKGGTGEHKWPRARVKIAESKQDWSLYDQLNITFINPSQTTGKVTIGIRTETGKGFTRYHEPLPHGKKVFTMQLPDSIKEEKVVMLSFVCTAPPEPQTVYIDDIKLTVSDESLKQSINLLKKRIIRESSPVFWQQAGMLQSRQNYIAELEKLEKSNIAPIEKSRTVLNVCKKYLADKKLMWQKANAKLLKDFAEYSTKNAVWDWCYVSGSQKIYRDTLPFVPGLDRKMSVELARRESEGVQIVLRSKEDLKNVQFSVVETAKNPGLDISLSPVGFVKVPPAGYPTENVNIIPDIELKFLKKFDLPKNLWQALWVDVKASPDCPAGTYNAKIRITADNAPELIVPLTIKVWNFVLPEFPSTPALINFHTNTNHAAYIPKSRRQKVADEFINYRRGKKSFEKLSDEAKKLCELEIATENFLLQHRVTPAPLYETLRQLKVENVKRWRDQGGKYFSVTYLQPVTVKEGQKFPEWLKKRALNNLAATIPALTKAGLMDGAYCYAFDEINWQKFHAAKDLMSDVKKLYPDLKLVTTTEDSDFGMSNGLDKFVDIWCPQVERYVKHIDKIKEVRKLGKKVWYYCCNYDPGIDMIQEKPLTAPRLLVGMALQKFEADGFLYYNVHSGNKRQDVITGGPVTTHTGNNGSKFNGCGLLIYPTVTGPAASLRLKAMRDGFDDSDYMNMLKQLKTDKLTAQEKSELQELLNIPDGVIVYLDPENYDQTGEELLRYRHEIGNFLDRVYSKAE